MRGLRVRYFAINAGTEIFGKCGHLVFGQTFDKFLRIVFG